MSTTNNPAVIIPPAEGERAQCNVKVDARIYHFFKRATEKRGESIASVLERMMECYTASVEGSTPTHVDGQPCPMGQLIENLARAAESYIRR